MFKDFIEKIEEIKNQEFEVTRSRGSLAIQQTQRNNMKRELMEAFFEGLQDFGAENGVDFYITADGLIMEIVNEDVMNKVAYKKDANDGDIEGLISVEFNLKIKNLDYDAEFEETLYLEEQAEKERKAKEKEIVKREKIKRDAEDRANKARLKEQKLAELIQKNQEANE